MKRRELQSVPRDCDEGSADSVFVFHFSPIMGQHFYKIQCQWIAGEAIPGQCLMPSHAQWLYVAAQAGQRPGRRRRGWGQQLRAGQRGAWGSGWKIWRWAWPESLPSLIPPQGPQEKPRLHFKAQEADPAISRETFPLPHPAPQATAAQLSCAHISDRQTERVGSSECHSLC